MKAKSSLIVPAIALSAIVGTPNTSSGEKHTCPTMLKQISRQNAMTQTDVIKTLTREFPLSGPTRIKECVQSIIQEPAGSNPAQQTATLKLRLKHCLANSVQPATQRPLQGECTTQLIHATTQLSNLNQLYFVFPPDTRPFTSEAKAEADEMEGFMNDAKGIINNLRDE